LAVSVVALIAAAGLAGCSSAAAETRPDGSVYVSAKDVAFVQASVEAPAGAAFQLYFENLDNVPHNVNVTGITGGSIAQGEVFTGPSGHTLDVPALPAGHYMLLCDVHPDSMRAELVAR